MDNTIKLSIIIVNYNVQYFLQNCLISVQQACRDIESEIFVVDNNSVDGSVEMVRKHFPEVTVIANKNNLGFSKANNQAIEIAQGKYILLLNPDTVVEHDTFKKCIAFMDQSPKTGGLGVKMIDGSGTYLPESKRGLPTPKVAFFKIFGLSRLFPKSRTFGQYHLGYIDQDESAQIEILSGAFMFLRKETLDKTGYLDEDFFMYGEDIDLSWRIVKAGYENFYLPETKIIHYKGESTKKSSVNYVFVFYRAMVIFAKKHFSKNGAQLFSIFINLAIYFRATVALGERLISKIALPALDLIGLTALMYAIQELYEKKIKFTQGGEYPDEIIMFSLPAMAAVWVITNFVFGAYSQPSRLNRLLRGLSAGTIVIMITYALLDESIRFSRALVLIFCLSAFLFLPAVRSILMMLSLIPKASRGTKRIAIVAKTSEVERIQNLLQETGVQLEKVVKIDPEPENTNYYKDFVGNIEQLDDLIHIYSINEVIFSSKDVSVSKIIDHMTNAIHRTDFKIAPPASSYIIGSSSNETSGEYYVVGTNSISLAKNKRRKRLLDFTASLLCLVIAPFIMVFFDKPYNLVQNLWKVLTNKMSFVGLPKNHSDMQRSLNLKHGILTPLSVQDNKKELTDNQRVNHYTKHYRLLKDLEILVRGFHKLDKQTVSSNS